MRCIRIHKAGPPENLEIIDRPVPEVPEESVRIRVHSFGLNRADLLERRGLYPHPFESTDIPGLEVSGTVEACGSSVHRIKTSQRVMALLAGKGYSEFVVCPESQCVELPDSMSFVDGAAFMEAFLTAHLNVFQIAQLERGQSILVHAGASGVGLAAIQLAAERGARVLATTRSESKLKACQDAGAIALRAPDFVQAVLEETNKAGVDMILDPVGKAYFEENCRCLALDGTWVTIGLLGGSAVPLELSWLLERRAHLVGSTLRNRSPQAKGAIIGRFLDDFGRDLAAGRIRPRVDKVFDAREIVAAHRHMESNANTGKLVCSWSE